MSCTLAAALPAASALLAAGMHACMFWTESVRFTHPATLAMMDVDATHADAVRLWAYHQGIYNLLLALMSAGGAGALLSGATTVGPTLIAGSATFMVAAAAALLLADRRRHRITGFIAQAGPAILTLVALTLTRQGVGP